MVDVLLLVELLRLHFALRLKVRGLYPDVEDASVGGDEEAVLVA